MKAIIKRLDAALDSFWIGFVKVGIRRLEVKYHELLVRFYTYKLQHVRRNRIALEITQYKARLHSVQAELCAINK